MVNGVCDAPKGIISERFSSVIGFGFCLFGQRYSLLKTRRLV